MVKRFEVYMLHPPDLGMSQKKTPYNQWIGLRENLQETMVFTIKYRAFL